MEYNLYNINKNKFRSLSGKGKRALTQHEHDSRVQMMYENRPLVEDEYVDQFESGIIREGAITHSLRRRQVEDYDEETAPKQARLRDVSEHHLFRKRTIAPSVDDSSNQVAMAHNAAVVTTHRHVVEILKLQKFEGAYYNSLNNDQKENLKAQIDAQMNGGKD